MTGVRAGAASVVLVVGVMVLLAGCGGDGSRSFVVGDGDEVLIVEWTRVGDDVSGSLTSAELKVPENDTLFGKAPIEGEAQRKIQQDSNAFTGTISGDSVRLQFGSGGLGTAVNGQLDGNDLKLVIAQEQGTKKVRFERATRADFDRMVAELQVAEKRRAKRAVSTRKRADAVTRKEITRVATAYQKALAPDSSDDPCKYLTATARTDVTSRTGYPEVAGQSCKTIIRQYERGARNEHPADLGDLDIDLRTTVYAAGTQLLDGAEVQFSALPNHSLGLTQQNGEWRLAEYNERR
jgi:hypothetical protein